MLTEQLYISYIYFAGLLSFFSPCIFPVLPIYLSILSQGDKPSIKKTIAFLIGLSFTFILLGFGAGLIGQIFFIDLVRQFGALLIIIFGLYQAEIINYQPLSRTINFRGNYQKDNLLKPFILGFTFSLGWTPYIGPILASILLLSSNSGNLSTSLFTMFIYMLGLSTPFIIFSLASRSLLAKTAFLKKHLPTIKKLSGYLLILMGILLFFNRVNILMFT